MVKFGEVFLLAVPLIPALSAQMARQDVVLTAAVIGDFGNASPQARDVAALVRSWNPKAIITTGDNNYPNGSEQTFDANVTALYGDFIARGVFFPTLGNHDYSATGLATHLRRFTLPGNERYYQVGYGPLDVFILNGVEFEQDGITDESTQAQWLQTALAHSRRPWQFVFTHSPPYGSGARHGSTPEARWPYALWGADAVFSGDDHLYEHLRIGSTPHFVNGAGGHELYSFRATPRAESKVRFNSDWGAQRLRVSATTATVEFITRGGQLIDRVVLRK